MGSAGRSKFALFAAVALAWAQPAAAEIDLSRASINRLPNGLTVMILEDRSFPVVSVQALYKSGAADEVVGKTGLAHFLEHLAFRASKNFPNAGATEAIYDSGGEWHGYTWLDQTTYFATVPKDKLDLLLRIEADRMSNVTIDPAAIQAEKGAVITEMHSYENDPASVLLDAVTAAAFQVNNYRNNTIGLESDVEQLTVEDSREFYERHYIPANAILTIVGDVETDKAKRLVEFYFRGIATRGTPRRNSSPEPAQRGERRILLHGPIDRQYFTLAYPAPAGSNPDVPAFLLMQQLLGAGSGFNFNQNDWGTAAEAGSLLHGVTGDIATWFIPTAARYIFTIKGSLDRKGDQSQLEREIERRLQSLRDQPPTTERLAAAKSAVLRELAADVETTEEAAHQLAYMPGIGGYDLLTHFPERVQAVTAEQVRQVAAAYLHRQARTVGWYVPGTVRAPLGQAAPNSPPTQLGKPAKAIAAPQPEMHRLSGGLPVILQPNPRTSNATIQLLLSAPVEGANAPADLPGLGVVTRSGSATDLAKLIANVRAAAAQPLEQKGTPAATPDAKLEEMIASAIGVVRPVSAKPIAAVVSGGIDPAAAVKLLDQAFGNLRVAPPPALSQESRTPSSTAVRMDRPFAQGALGYIAPAPAPPPRTRNALGARMLLYVLSHDYSGRLGRSAIGDKGLAYHIASAYRTDGREAWITLTTGVDPARADALEAEFRAQVARLVTNPPTAAEIEAARSHILGRSISAAQSNQEIADKLTREYLEAGNIRTHNELSAILQAITADDIAAIAKDFGKGTILRVDVDPPKR